MTNENTLLPALTDFDKADRSPIDDILESLDSLSAFQLHRLECKISSMLGEPKRIALVKSRLSSGDEIEYFLPAENRMVAAVFMKHNRTRAVVRHVDSTEQWTIPYSWINVQGDEFHLASRGGELTRENLSVGEFVGFTDRQNQELFGTVVRLNKKTVSIDCEDGRSWRVGYSFLFRVISSDANESTGRPNQQLLIE